jgi:glycosyltransferase involved in cell wall biosynthesis
MSDFCIVHISSFPPAPCGIAEYISNLARYMHGPDCKPTGLNIALRHDVANACRGEGGLAINPADDSAMKTAANEINAIARKVVFIQHEFKLFGGPDGENLLVLLNAIEAPIVATLHTVWPSFPDVRRRIVVELLRTCTHVTVFTDRAAKIIRYNYGATSSKVSVVPHGVPDVALRLPSPDGLGRLRMISLGLLRPAKGIELVLSALSQLRSEGLRFKYIICGAAHPRNTAAMAYLEGLHRLVEGYGLGDSVEFVNEYVDGNRLVELIQSCDIGVLPYTVKEQSSSGVLALVMACGRPVIATDFQCACATLRCENGIVTPIGDVAAMAAAIRTLARDIEMRERMMSANYDATRPWIWPVVAAQFAAIAARAANAPTAALGSELLKD